jgi:hypothetical protein
LPGITKIILHLEEERPDYAMTTVHDLTSDRKVLADEMSALAKASHPLVKDVRELILFQSEPFKELKLSFTVILDKALSLADAHEIVTTLERLLRKKYPELSRIVIHSEPG